MHSWNSFTVGCLLGIMCVSISVSLLQAMCVEQQCVLDLSSHPLFTPVPVLEGRSPLRDCVLSVSQFIGAERESLIELARHLGAR